MPHKDWVKYLAEGFELLVRQDSLFGIWYGFAVVLVFNGECICRYDTAHGAPHKDVLGKRSGLIRKEWCENLPFKEAFAHAIHDLSENYQSYHDFYYAN